MGSENNPRSFRAGQSAGSLLRRSNLNAAGDDVAALKRESARHFTFPPVDMTPAGSFFAKITQDADFASDEVYRCTRQRPDSPETETSAMTFSDETIYPDNEQSFTATNIAEVLAHSHSLSVGMIVQIFVYVDEEGYREYYFSASVSSSAILVSVTSNAAGGGCYYGKSIAADSTADGSSEVLGTSFGTVSSTEDCLILNAAELTNPETGMHQLTNGLNTSGYFPGMVQGTTADGKKIVVINGLNTLYVT